MPLSQRPLCTKRTGRLRSASSTAAIMPRNDDDIGDPGNSQSVDDALKQRSPVDVRQQLVVFAEAARGTGSEQHRGDTAFSRHGA